MTLCWDWWGIDSLNEVVQGTLRCTSTDGWAAMRSVKVARLGLHAIAQGQWNARSSGDRLDIVDQHDLPRADVLARVYVANRNSIPREQRNIRRWLNLPRGVRILLKVYDRGQRPEK